MTYLINDLTLSIKPNSAPEWTGNIKGAIFNPVSKLIIYTAPLTTVDGGFEYISLNLWIDTWTNKNEDSYTISGTTYSVRPLITHRDPTIICPCSSLLDEFIENDENSYGLGYTEIYHEKLGDVLSALFVGTGWSVLIDSNLIANYPVVTEVNPVVVLNGTLLEQLKQLLGIFTPNNLWDQSLSFFLNIFTLEILIVPPDGGISSFVVDLDQVKPIDFNVRKEDVAEKPLNIMLQEFETSLYRHIDHFGYGLYNEESYDYKTSASIVEADNDTTDIRAQISGSRKNIGKLTLQDNHNVIIDESRYGTITTGWGTALIFTPTYTISWSENKTTDVNVETVYEYILGPPYGNMEDQGYEYKDGNIPNSVNSCFPSSLPGTRQQMSRDVAPLKITLDKYPSVLVNTDGIRVSKKSVTTTEEIKVIGNAPEDGQNYVAGDTENDQLIITEIEESFAYDAEGNLITDRVKKVVTKDSGEQTITNTTMIISPISDDFYAQTTYSMQSEYSDSGELINSTVTDVSIQTISGDQTGPKPISAFASVEDNDLLREKELSSGSSSDKYAYGTVYTGVNNLTLEEAETYLNTHYILGPDSAVYVSFESEFIDPRNVLGGFVTLVGAVLNRSKLFELDISDFEGDESEKPPEKSTYDTRTVNIPSHLYRITGIALQWDGEKTPVTALALCRME